MEPRPEAVLKFCIHRYRLKKMAYSGCGTTQDTPPPQAFNSGGGHDVIGAGVHYHSVDGGINVKDSWNQFNKISCLAS